jgi:hypothetical protein
MSSASIRPPRRSSPTSPARSAVAYPHAALERPLRPAALHPRRGVCPLAVSRGDTRLVNGLGGSTPTRGSLFSRAGWPGLSPLMIPPRPPPRPRFYLVRSSMVERPFVKRWVAGSSPVGPAVLFQAGRFSWVIVETDPVPGVQPRPPFSATDPRMERRGANPDGEGSIPSGGTDTPSPRRVWPPKPELQGSTPWRRANAATSGRACGSYPHREWSDSTRCNCYGV